MIAIVVSIVAVWELVTDVVIITVREHKIGRDNLLLSEKLASLSEGRESTGMVHGLGNERVF